MADNTVESLIRLEWERASQSRLQRGISALSDSLKKTFGRDAPSAINQTTDALAQQNKQLEKNKKTLDDYNNQFDKVNQDVGLAGDAASNLSAIGGVAGGAAGEAIGQGAGILEVVEALPRLKASLSAMPQVIGAAASALGPVGLGLGAVALATAVAIQRAADQVNAAKLQLAGTIEGERTVAEFITQGGTVEEAKARVAELDRLLKQEADIRDKNNTRIQEGFANLTAQGGDVVARLGVATGLFSDVQAAVDGANTNIAKYEAEQRKLNEAIQEGAFADNEAAEAKRAATQATLQEADLAADSLRRQQQANEATVEQNEQRLKAIENEEAILREQLAVLEESGDTSEEVTQRIEALNKQLSVLGEEARFIKEDALPEQAASEAAQKRIADAKKAREGERKETEKADKTSTDDLKKHYEERAKLETEHQDALLAIVEKAADAAEKAVLKREYDLADALTDARAERSDAVLAAQRDEAKALRDHQRLLVKIQKDARDQEKNLLFDQDFRAIFELRQKTTNDMLSATNNLNVADDERKIALNQELDDLRTNLDRRRAEIQLNFEREAKERAQQKQDELAKERQKYAEKQKLQQQAAAQELALTQQSEQQKVQIIHNALNMISQTAGNFLSSLQSRLTMPAGSTQSRTSLDSSRAENQNLRSRTELSGGNTIQITVNETTNPQKTGKIVNQKLQKLLNT